MSRGRRAEPVADRVARIRERIGTACAKAGRTVASVRLVGASKHQEVDAIRDAFGAGVVDFGENYVQEAEGKIAAVPDASWHFLGHLQRNKAKRAATLFAWVQSVDSARLLHDLSRHAIDAGRVLPVLIEVNLGGEESKGGVAPDQLAEVLAASHGNSGVSVRGLMAIPPFGDDAEESRPFFALLGELLRRHARDVAGEPMNELSMGMSNDFETAIEEGATMIRVGTDLFGRRTGG